MAKWWTLKVLSGPDSGRVYNLKKDRTVIGRVKGDVLFNDDGELSSVHAEISYDGTKGLMILRDLKSRNGCKVNGERTEKRYLMPGDSIKIGSTEFVLEPPSAEETIVSDEGRKKDSPPPPPLNEHASASGKTGNALPDKSAAAKTALDSPEGEKANKENKVTQTSNQAREYRNKPLDRDLGPDFKGFFGRFFGVLFSPTRFFDFLLTEHSLITKGDPLWNAIIFASVVLLIGGGINGVLSYYCTFVWKTMPEGLDYGMSPIALGLKHLASILLLPLMACIFHVVCLALGGRAPFKVAVRVTCYFTAVQFFLTLSSFLPKVGQYVPIAIAAYAIYVFAIAAIRLYYISTHAAVAVWSLCCAITVSTMVYSQRYAFQVNQLVRSSTGQALPVAVASSGASAQNGVATQTSPINATSETKAPVATTSTNTTNTVNESNQAPQVAEQQTAQSQPQQQEQRDPAAATPPDSQPAESGDPQPPELPHSVDPEPPSN